MAIVVLNSTGANITAAASTWSIVPHSSIEGGAAFIVGLGFASTAVSVSTITDNTTNVYLRASQCPSPKTGAGAELWWTPSISSACTRVSITLDTTSSGSIGILQARSVSTANALSGSASSAVTGNSTIFGAHEFTPTRPNCLVVSFERLNFSTAGTITNQGGMTTWLSTTSTGALRTHAMYLVQGAASTVSGTFQTSSRGMSAGVIAAFSDTSVLGGTRPRTVMLTGVGR